MGACASLCGRRSRQEEIEVKPWQGYSDREETWQAPSTTHARQRRGVSTVSLTEDVLIEHAADESRPRRAEAARRELKRRAA